MTTSFVHVTTSFVHIVDIFLLQKITTRRNMSQIRRIREAKNNYFVKDEEAASQKKAPIMYRSNPVLNKQAVHGGKLLAFALVSCAIVVVLVVIISGKYKDLDACKETTIKCDPKTTEINILGTECIPNRNNLSCDNATTKLVNGVCELKIRVPDNNNYSSINTGIEVGSVLLVVICLVGGTFMLLRGGGGGGGEDGDGGDGGGDGDGGDGGGAPAAGSQRVAEASAAAETDVAAESSNVGVDLQDAADAATLRAVLAMSQATSQAHGGGLASSSSEGYVTAEEENDEEETSQEAVIKAARAFTNFSRTY